MSNNIETQERKFKSFNETFPRCAYALALAIIYPNPENIRKRLLIFVFFVVFYNSVLYFWLFTYYFDCVKNRDIYNICRNTSMCIMFVVLFYKALHMIYKTDKFANLLNKISNDLLEANDMDEDYQAIYERYINVGKVAQNCWVILPIALSSQFPIFAAISTIHETLKSDIGQRYMVYDMKLKLIEGKEYNTPYFELVFVYCSTQCFFLCANFSGLDGSFCIATNHLCMKIKIMVHKVHRAFTDSNNREELEINVKKTIKDHQEILEFYNDLQDIYGGWLLVIFLLNAASISTNLYVLYLSDHFDLKYITFTLSGVIHMFTPCYFSSNLMKLSEELSWDLYDAAWENWADPVVTKLLMFMIAKAQQTLVLSGMGFVDYNMQLFISVLQTSYSYFTLICS